MPAFTPSITIKTQPTSAVSAVPGQNITLTVEPSANFDATFFYQWKKGGSQTSIAEANQSSILFDAPASGSETYCVSVSALSGGLAVADTTSNTSTITIVDDTTPYAKFAVYPESGSERFLRLRNLGYV